MSIVALSSRIQCADMLLRYFSLLEELFPRHPVVVVRGRCGRIALERGKHFAGGPYVCSPRVGKGRVGEGAYTV